MKTARKEETEVHRLGGRIVLLPDYPKTASPVPSLTSIHAREGRGNYGDANYRGNCSGLLIEDLLRYFQPRRVLDPMAGSGTCADVCKVLGIAWESLDLTQGFDATDPTHFVDLQPVDFVWLHPPYWRMIPYCRVPRCLAEAPTLSEFLQRLGKVFRNCLSRLTPDGIIAVLIGDGKEYGTYLGLPFRTLQVAELEGLWLAAPEIVRFSHGATSSRKVYNTSFIPRLHDVCLVLKRREDIAPQWKPEIKVDFGAHLLHRGAFDALSASAPSPDVTRCRIKNSPVDSTSEPIRGDNAHYPLRNHRSTACQSTSRCPSTKVCLDLRSPLHASVAGIQTRVREGRKHIATDTVRASTSLSIIDRADKVTSFQLEEAS